MSKKVGIIGGMGPYAGENYLTRFLVACTDRLKKSGGEVSDQRYPAHYLFQQPVPDRTKALIDGQDEYLRVFFELRAQLKALEHLGVSAAAIAALVASLRTLVQALVALVSLQDSSEVRQGL